jgi:hypothetical protein
MRDDYDDRPRRRQPPASTGGVPTLVWVLVAGASLVVLGCAGIGVVFLVGFGEVARQDAKEVAQASKTEAIDAATLQADYQADDAKAATKYGGKTIRVKIRVDESRQTGDELEVRQTFGFLKYVEADIPLGEAGRAAKGSTVTVIGKVRSTTDGAVRMGSCTVE